MARPKKPQYEFFEAKGLYRKRIKDHTGKTVALYGKTPDELTDKIALFQRQQEELAEDAENPPVEAYARKWFDLDCGSISPQTQRDYLRILNNHIIPYFEGLRIRDVRPNDIKAVIARVSKSSESVHNKTYMLLKRMFTAAFENGDIQTNPCPEMHNGGIAPSEKKALSDEQVETLLSAVKGNSSYVFCMIALYAGLRREEILGLMWDCVHFDNPPRIEVRRALRHYKNRPMVSETLKSDAARRTIPIPPQLEECLLEEKQKSTSDYVIKNGSDGPMSDTQARRLWDQIVRRTAKSRTYYRYVDGVKTAHHVEAKLGEKAKRGGYSYTINFEVTPHILRHTYITNLLLAGVDIKTVQYLAGHEKSKTTLDIYAHLKYNRPEDIGNKIGQAFSDETEDS